ncbi:MAG TPA: DUF6279 family lipoprotein [Caldimonas sp.]|nr:DUF6279 family lipoprotein [Caldimonas sp.]
MRTSIIAVLAFALALALAGCSALKLGYGQADSLVYRWLDGYADFDGVQGSHVRRAIAEWFEWHRRTQLPDYADLLARVEAEVAADTTPQRVCEWWGEAKTRTDRAIDHAIPAVADIARTLTPMQFAHIEEQQAKTNVEFKERAMERDPKRRARDAADRFADRAEWLYGDVTRPQRERIARAVQEAAFDPLLGYGERLRRQEDGVRTLRRLAGLQPAAAQAELRGWLDRLEQSPNEAYRRQAERQQAFNCRVFADLHNDTSRAQREFAQRRLHGWIGDLRALAREAGA